MSFYNTIQQGKFTADGTNKQLVLRSNVDWIRVWNETAFGRVNGSGVDLNTEFYFQRGMTDTQGLYWRGIDAGGVGGYLVPGQLAAGTGFHFFNEGTDAVVSAATAFTGISNVTQPVITTGSTTGLFVGSVVRLSQTEAQRLAANALGVSGIDFQIGAVNAGVSFTIAYAMATAPGAGVAAAAGSWRKVNIDTMFYPKFRWIANISSAANAVITTTVDHGYTAGQKIRVSVPSSLNGMIEMHNVIGTITAVTASTVTTDIDSTNFSAFTWPVAPLSAFTPATISPYGVDSAKVLALGASELTGAQEDISIIGVELMGASDVADAIAGPAGGRTANGPPVTYDTMYWIAGRSFSVDNV